MLIKSLKKYSVLRLVGKIIKKIFINDSKNQKEKKKKSKSNIKIQENRCKLLLMFWKIILFNPL